MDIRIRPVVAYSFLCIAVGFLLVPFTRGRDWLGWLVVLYIGGGSGVLCFMWCRDAVLDTVRRLKDGEPDGR